MERPLLNDEHERPSDAVLTKYLGRAKGAWDALVEGLNEVLDGASLDWRFYKRWWSPKLGECRAPGEGTFAFYGGLHLCF